MLAQISVTQVTCLAVRSLSTPIAQPKKNASSQMSAEPVLQGKKGVSDQRRKSRETPRGLRGEKEEKQRQDEQRERGLWKERQRTRNAMSSCKTKN